MPTCWAALDDRGGGMDREVSEPDEVDMATPTPVRT